jgi:hypothetical protein
MADLELRMPAYQTAEMGQIAPISVPSVTTAVPPIVVIGGFMTGVEGLADVFA